MSGTRMIQPVRSPAAEAHGMPSVSEQRTADQTPNAIWEPRKACPARSVLGERRRSVVVMWRLAVSGWTPPRPDLPTPNGGVPRPDLLPPSTTGDGRETAPVTWRAIEAIPVFVMAIVFAGVAGAAV